VCVGPNGGSLRRLPYIYYWRTKMKTTNAIILTIIILSIFFGSCILVIEKKYNDNLQNLREYYVNQSESQKQRIYYAELDAQNCYIEKVNTQIQLNNTKKELFSKSQCVIKQVNEIYVDELDLVAQKVAKAHNYTYGVYDCTEYSRDLAIEFRKLGYNATTKLVTVDCHSDFWKGTEGCYDWDNNHEIVEVTIYYEATGGFRIPTYPYKDYGLKK
jgi:hypothetical protein